MFEIKAAEFDYKQIMDSGQAFRMFGDGICIAGDKCCQVLGKLVECPEEDNEFWKNYFDLNEDYSRFIESIDPEDKYLSSAAEFGSGIRILRQDPWEMLITFIISQRRSIPSIRTCVAKLCEGRGRECSANFSGKSYKYFAFPTPNELEKASMEELLGCGLGYRAEYIYLAAKAAFADETLLYRLEDLSYEELIEELMCFKGVGIKVANCVALFAYHKIEAFPVDVWIKRVLDQHYGGSFPMELYKGYAGVLQQYIFYFARKN